MRIDHKMSNGNGNGNGNGFFLDGLKRSSLERDVFGFDFKMQPIQSSSSSSYPCKRNSLTALPPLPPSQPFPGFTVFNGDDGIIGGGGGGGPSFCNTNYQVSSSLSDVYYVAGLGDAVSSRTFLPFTSGQAFVSIFPQFFSLIMQKFVLWIKGLFSDLVIFHFCVYIYNRVGE